MMIKEGKTKHGQSTQYRICQNCNKRPGKPFAFHYGKQVGSSSTPTTGGTTVSTTYRIGGKQEVSICSWCVALRRILVNIPVGGTIILGYYCTTASGPDLKDTRLLGYFLLFVGLALLVGLNYELGNRYAIKIKRKELEKQGYDTFWTPARFRMLK